MLDDKSFWILHIQKKATQNLQWLVFIVLVSFNVSYRSKSTGWVSGLFQNVKSRIMCIIYFCLF